NDPEVRRHCLDRSIERLRPSSLEVDYVPVDNVDSAFSSAGAALNHGAALARNDYLVFVHQDVYLHSIEALERTAGWSARSGIGWCWWENRLRSRSRWTAWTRCCS